MRGLTLTGRVIYTSESYANDANTQQLPAWTRVDLGARYTFTSPWNGKPIVVRANVENVFNEAYWNSYRTVSSAVSPRRSAHLSAVDDIQFLNAAPLSSSATNAAAASIRGGIFLLGFVATRIQRS